MSSRRAVGDVFERQRGAVLLALPECELGLAEPAEDAQQPDEAVAAAGESVLRPPSRRLEGDLARRSAASSRARGHATEHRQSLRAIASASTVRPVSVQHLGEIRVGVPAPSRSSLVRATAIARRSRSTPSSTSAERDLGHPERVQELASASRSPARRGRERLLAVAHGVAVAPTQDERPREPRQQRRALARRPPRGSIASARCAVVERLGAAVERPLRGARGARESRRTAGGRRRGSSSSSARLEQELPAGRSPLASVRPGRESPAGRRGRAGQHAASRDARPQLDRAIDELGHLAVRVDPRAASAAWALARSAAGWSPAAA